MNNNGLPNHEYHEITGTQARKGWVKRSYEKLEHSPRCARCAEEQARRDARRKIYERRYVA